MENALFIIASILCVMFFARLPLAIWFFNRENGTSGSLFDYSRAEQTVLLFYWYKATKEENKPIALLLNGILLLVGAAFLGTIVYTEYINYEP